MIICVRPFIKGVGETVEDRVGVDVAAEMAQEVLVMHKFGLGGALEDGAAVVVAQVVGFAVAVEDALGQQAGAGLGVLADEEVVMVGEEDVGDNDDAELVAVGFELA